MAFGSCSAGPTLAYNEQILLYKKVHNSEWTANEIRHQTDIGRSRRSFGHHIGGHYHANKSDVPEDGPAVLGEPGHHKPRIVRAGIYVDPFLFHAICSGQLAADFRSKGGLVKIRGT